MDSSVFQTPNIVLCRDEQQRRLVFEKVILFLLAIYLFIDTLNGLFTITLGLPNVLSAAYKQGLLGLLLLFAFQFEQKRFIYALLVLFAIFVWASFRFFLIDNVLFLHAFQEAVKVAYLFMMVLILSKFQSLNSRWFGIIIAFAMAALLFNVMATYLGFGKSTYKSFGAKGFFYAGNATSGVIVICASFILRRLFDRSLVLFVLSAMFLALLSLVIGTKAGFLGVVIITFLVMLFRLDVKTLLLGLLLLASIGTVVYTLSDVLTTHPLYERVIFFYKTGGIERVLFSGRDIKLQILWPYLTSGDLAVFLFGVDTNDLLKIGFYRAEFDWVDMQITFGIVMSLGVYLGYTILFLHLLTTPKNYVVESAIIGFIVLILISTIAGHVMYNGMVTPLWALLIATALGQGNKTNVNVTSQHPSGSV